MINEPPEPKPVGAVWRPCRDLSSDQFGLKHEFARYEAQQWKEARAQREDRNIGWEVMDIWLTEMKRSFAIETGQIEGLYHLRRGVAETLITEGFERVRGVHSATEITDKAIKGLLQDQEAALEMLFAHAEDGRPLTAALIREWHQLLTRHQKTAPGIDLYGRRVEIPLRRGAWKIRPNNPRRIDGFVHEYCPPEQVESEIDRFLEFHRGHAKLELAPELEAAWLHHEFVRIHPFQDGNGRVSRMLMALPFIKAGEFPPIIHADEKLTYFAELEEADDGRIEGFVAFLGAGAALRMSLATIMEKFALHRDRYRHANGGITRDGVYYPPEDDALEF